MAILHGFPPSNTIMVGARLVPCEDCSTVAYCGHGMQFLSSNSSHDGQEIFKKTETNIYLCDTCLCKRKLALIKKI